MNNQDRNISELAGELERLRKRVAELEVSVAVGGEAQEDLHQTILRQNAILNNISDIAWLKDRESRFIAVNEPFGKACGFAPADLVGMTDLDIWPRNLAESYRADDAEVMRTGKRKSVEERLVEPDGSEKWIETIKTPIIDAHGNVIGTTGIARDITQRKQTEKLLKQSEERYRLLFESNPHPMWVYDLETLAFLEVNNTAVKMYGFSGEEFLSMTIADIRPAEDIPRLLENVSCVSCGLDEAGSWRHRKKDGTIIDVDIVSHALVYNGRKAELVLAWDITEQKRAENSLRHVTRLYAFLSQMNQIIVRTRDRDDLFRAICQVAIEFGQFRLAWIGLVDDSGTSVMPFTHAGHEDGYLQNIRIILTNPPPLQGPTGTALQSGRISICNDIATDIRMAPWREEAMKRGYRSSAAIPFRSKGTIAGTLNLYASEADFFTEEERKLLEEIGIDISYALDAIDAEQDRKSSYAALQKSEHRYHHLLETLVHGVQENDCDGTITYSNAAHHRILGYKPGELIGKGIWASQPSIEEQEALQKYLAHLVREQPSPVSYLTKCRRKDGSLIDLQIDWDYQRDASGNLMGFISVITDITDRKKAFKDLRQRTTELSAILEVSKNLAATLDLKTILQTATDGVVTLSSLDTAAVYLLDGELLRLRATTPPLPPQFPDELCCASLVDHPHIVQAINSHAVVVIPDMITADLTPAERLVAEMRNLRSVLFLPLLSGAKCSGVLIVGSVSEPKTLEDSTIDLCRTLANLIALAVENALLFLSSKQYADDLAREIEERRKTEEALRTREEQLRVIFETSQAGIILVDPKGTITFANNRMAEMFGMTLDALVGTSYPDHVHERERTAGDERMRQLIRGEIHSVSTERHYVRADGTDFWGYLSGRRLTNPDGSLRALVGIIADITDRKKAEQEHLEMERRVLHAQKLESLGVLAGGIAHDFNNLLMAILGNLDMALLKLPPGSPAAMNIEQSAQAARRASDLTRQMLAYSGRGRFVVELTDLNALVEENVRLFRVAIAKKTTLSLHLTRPLPLIEADKGQLQQVIMNLLTNASEAIGDKPGVISLSTWEQGCDARCLRQSRIADVQPADKFVCLEVSDTGAGMDEETVQRLFDPFFTTKSTGRGLGMSAILGIMRGHKGTVFVDTQEGQGTTIRVLFPVVDESISEEISSARIATEELLKEPLSGTVLIVDDEEIVRAVCKDMLTAFGMQVMTASDGEEALEVFGDNADRIDYIIMDLTMPKMDGMTAFRELIRIRPDAKVILSSGYDQKDSLQQLSGKGLTGFIQKPYTLDNLYRVLSNARER